MFLTKYGTNDSSKNIYAHHPLNHPSKAKTDSW